MKITSTNWTAPGSRPIRGVGITLIVLSLAGCMVGPDYSRPHVAMPNHYVGPLAQGHTQEAVDLDQWWKSFHDPVLDQIVAHVLSENLDLKSAQARVAEARAAAKEAVSDLYPSGTLDGDLVRQRQSLLSPEGRLASRTPRYSRDQTLQQIDAGASWELDLAGGLHRRASAYRDEAEAAEASQADVRISLVAEAADAYFRMRALQANLKLLEAQIVVDRQLLRLTRDQLAAGVATNRDQDDVQAALQSEQYDEAALRDLLRKQGYRLDVLLGDAPGTDRLNIGAFTVAEWTAPGIPSDIQPAQLLRRRPDVIAAERRLAARTENIGEAISQYYPSLSLGGLLGFERLGAGNLFETQSFQPALLLGIHWRLFDFGKVDAEVAMARSGRAEALANFRNTVLHATEDVEDALSTLAKIDSQERHWNQVVDADARAKDSAQQSFGAGASSMIEVLHRRRSLLVAERGQVTLRADRARATVELFRALGGGWHSSSQAKSSASSRHTLTPET